MYGYVWCVTSTCAMVVPNARIVVWYLCVDEMVWEFVCVCLYLCVCVCVCVCVCLCVCVSQDIKTVKGERDVCVSVCEKVREGRTISGWCPRSGPRQSLVHRRFVDRIFHHIHTCVLATAVQAPIFVSSSLPLVVSGLHHTPHIHTHTHTDSHTHTHGHDTHTRT